MEVQKLSHQDIDWDTFSLFEDNEFKIFSEKIKYFFQSENLYLSDKEIYTLFGSLISEFALPKFISGFGKKFIIHNEKSFLIHPSLFLVDIVPMFDDKYWIDLGFFHRHPAFQKLLKKLIQKNY